MSELDRDDPRTRERVVSLAWDDRDRHRWWLTAPAVGAVVVAALMAVFGLPPLDLHPPTHRLGIMDPFCGGTRSARLTAQGDLAGAWKYNPLGIVAVLGAAVAVARAVIGLVTRRWLSISVAWTSRWRRAAILVVVVLLVLLEIRQQGRADLLMEGTSTFG